jgi:phosphoribosylanthranilate isomerase
VVETRVKVCGLTRREDVAAAVAQGAWAVGFVVWSGSPRAVTPAQLRELAGDVPAEIKRVAIVVNPALDDARRMRDEAGVATLQLHGGEDVGPFLSLGMELFRAVSLETDADIETAAALPDEVTVLVDAHDPIRRGGTGERADWARAAALSRRRPVILAGGLRADNVREAVAQVTPWAIDVSSGLESSPGIKDHAKMAQFFATLRSTEPRGFSPGD